MPPPHESPYLLAEVISAITNTPTSRLRRTTPACSRARPSSQARTRERPRVGLSVPTGPGWLGRHSPRYSKESSTLTVPRTLRSGSQGQAWLPVKAPSSVKHLRDGPLGGRRVAQEAIARTASVLMCRLPSEQLVRELDGPEVPPEQPVEKGAVIVATLVGPLVTDGEAVGNMEQRSLIFRQQLSFK